MKDMSIFRTINTIEIKIIATSFNNISAKLSPVLDNLKSFLYISINKLTTNNNYPQIYLITKDLQKIIDDSNISNKIYTAGLYFGFIKKGNFNFSIEGVEYLYKQNIFSDFQQIQVNKLGEKSILYGNNILKNMVVKSSEKLKERDFLLIFNVHDEMIAIARSRVNSTSFMNLKAKEIICINLSDKGFYLRIDQ